MTRNAEPPTEQDMRGKEMRVENGVRGGSLGTTYGKDLIVVKVIFHQ